MPRKNLKSGLRFTDTINSAFWLHRTSAPAVIRVEGEYMEWVINIYFKSMWRICLSKHDQKNGSARVFKTQRKAGGKL